MTTNWVFHHSEFLFSEYFFEKTNYVETTRCFAGTFTTSKASNFHNVSSSCFTAVAYCSASILNDTSIIFWGGSSSLEKKTTSASLFLVGRSLRLVRTGDVSSSNIGFSFVVIRFLRTSSGRPGKSDDLQLSVEGTFTTSLDSQSATTS